MLAWVCLALISLVAVTMPYKNFLLNALETIYLACLFLIAFFAKPPDEESDGAKVIALQIVLSSLLFMVCYHFYHFLKERSFIQHLVLKARQTYENLRKRKTEEDDVNDSCDANVRTVPSSVVSIHSHRYDELREPLLEPDSHSN